MAVTAVQRGFGVLFAAFAVAIGVSAVMAAAEGSWLTAGRGAALAGAFVIGALVQLRWDGRWPVRAVVANTVLVGAFLVLLLVEVV